MLSHSQQAIALNEASLGHTLKLIANNLGLQSPAHLQKQIRETPFFEAKWIAARRDGLELLADSLLDVHDRLELGQARLHSDNIKWLLSKRASDTYGDKLDVSVGVTVDIKQALMDARARVVTVQDRIGIEGGLDTSTSLEASTSGLETSPSGEVGNSASRTLEELLS